MVQTIKKSKKNVVVSKEGNSAKEQAEKIAEDFYKYLEVDEIEKTEILLDASENFWEFCLYMDYAFFRTREEVLHPIAEAMQNLILPEDPEDELEILNVS